jgi:hypothetical protein
LPPLSTVEDLYIEDRNWQLAWKNEDTLWSQLLLPFTMVRNLYLSEEVAPGIAAALRGLVGDRITEVLPSLQNIFVEGFKESGPVPENLGRFVTARRPSHHPITISDGMDIGDAARESQSMLSESGFHIRLISL